jgi:hypothetical protein
MVRNCAKLVWQGLDWEHSKKCLLKGDSSRQGDWQAGFLGKPIKKTGKRERWENIFKQQK